MNHFLPRIVLLLTTAATATAQCSTSSTAAYTEAYGSGCLTLPLLGAASLPQLGSTATLVATNLPADTFAVVTMLSFAAPSSGIPTVAGFALPAGCLNYMTAPIYSLGLPAGGVAATSITVPANPLFQGLVIHSQAGAVTTGADWMEMTNALCLYCGT